VNQARLFTSESVTGGHPDKLCDQISDAVVDRLLEQDPYSRVAVESLISHGQVVVAGEVTTAAYAPVADIVREVLLDQGYDTAEAGIDGASCGVSVLIEGQSKEIAQGVDRSVEVRDLEFSNCLADQSAATGESESSEGGAPNGTNSRMDCIKPMPLDSPKMFQSQGAGDQGMVFGYAVDETPELMPMPIHAAHRLAEQLESVRLTGRLPYLRPDGKTQVTVAYQGPTPVGIDSIVVSAQHEPSVDQRQLTADLRRQVIDPVVDSLGLPAARRVLVNPSGSFVVGGPAADTGLTGRKIIVDTYGGMARHGGGAFSGKDPSKVDRSGAYAARWIAKNVVAAGLAQRCEIQIAYAIGAAEPVSLSVETFGTGQVPDQAITRAIAAVFDLRPAAIIAALNLLRPLYRATATFGHFGRKPFSWERTDRTGDLLAAL
jgi:S-adenosylmethionine synthetase